MTGIFARGWFLSNAQEWSASTHCSMTFGMGTNYWQRTGGNHSLLTWWEQYFYAASIFDYCSITINSSVTCNTRTWRNEILRFVTRNRRFWDQKSREKHVKISQKKFKNSPKNLGMVCMCPYHKLKRSWAPNMPGITENQSNQGCFPRVDELTKRLNM